MIPLVENFTEMNVAAAIRVHQMDNARAASCVQVVSPTAVQVHGQTFPASFAFDASATQSELYRRTIEPYMSSFLEGFDVSVVTYGQKGTGKSYSLFGPGLNCIFASECEQGLVQRFTRDLFQQLGKRSERTFRISVSWAEITAEEEQIVDLLNNLGLVPCQTVKDVFDWIQNGFAARSPDNHGIFTLILEQQWITPNNLNQHKLSTLSFCDLVGTERRFVPNDHNQNISVPRNFGLQALEYFINSSASPETAGGGAEYAQSTLPTLLKDSFGGRAQTVFLLCVSGAEEDATESLFNLELTFRVQSIVNYVFMNAFTDNNVPIDALCRPSTGDPAVDFRNNNENAAQSQRFALQQWLKLLQNAEGLFHKIITTGPSVEGLKQEELQKIEEWLYLKAECDDCINLGELEVEPPAAIEQRSLGPIAEEDVDEEDPDEEEEEETQPDLETQETINSSDNESDSEICQKLNDIDLTVDKLMSKFQTQTDDLVEQSHRDYLHRHPHSALDSFGSVSKRPGSTSLHSSRDAHPTRERRRSVQPGCELSHSDLAKLTEICNASTEERPSKSNANSVESNLKKYQDNIHSLESQIAGVEATIELQKELIEKMEKGTETRSSAKKRLKKKKEELKNEYEKTKRKLQSAVSKKNKEAIKSLTKKTTEYEQQLSYLESLNHIASETSEKIKKHEQSLRLSKRELKELQKRLDKERRLREMLEKQLEKEQRPDKRRFRIPHAADGRNLMRDMNTKLSNIDYVLSKKNENLQNDADNTAATRHEIRNLRRTKEHLQREIKLLREQDSRSAVGLSYEKERKLLECDEAIEAIDTAIELKNELICGRRSVDTDESIARDQGEALLISRLNRLSVEEMRTLLYKYFQKVIDLKDSSRALEIQLADLERQKEAWEWREKVLTNAIRQARLEGKNKELQLQRQHETMLNKMLKHFAADANASSSFAATSDELSNEIDLYKPRHASLTSSDVDFYGLPAIKAKPEAAVAMGHHLAKYKPLDGRKDAAGGGGGEERKNKLFSRIQVFTTKKQTSSTTTTASVIPQQNLKQLTATPYPTLGAAKVTRQKKKLIIQQDYHQ